MFPARVETINARRFLTESIAGPDFEQGHFELSLLSTDSKRYIWTRLFYSRWDRVNATGAMLALTVEGHNLMSVDVGYENDRVIFKSLSITTAVDWQNQGYRSNDLRSGTFYFLHVDAGLWRWHRGGSIGPSWGKHAREDFERIKAHGFYDWAVFHESINPEETAYAFLDQITGYLRDPSTFEVSIAPNIQPRLVR